MWILCSAITVDIFSPAIYIKMVEFGEVLRFGGIFGVRPVVSHQGGCTIKFREWIQKTYTANKLGLHRLEAHEIHHLEPR